MVTGLEELLSWSLLKGKSLDFSCSKKLLLVVTGSSNFLTYPNSPVT